MRINKMITQEKRPWSYIKFSQLILKGNVWRSVWRICMLILGLKGLKKKNALHLSVIWVKVLIGDTICTGDGTTILRGHLSHTKNQLLALQMEYLHFSVILRPSWVMVWPRESNPQPPALQSSALPTELILAWDHALSLLSLYVSHGKRALFFSLSSQRNKEGKKNNPWSQVKLILLRKSPLTDTYGHSKSTWSVLKRFDNILISPTLKFTINKLYMSVYMYISRFSIVCIFTMLLLFCGYKD